MNPSLHRLLAPVVASVLGACSTLPGSALIDGDRAYTTMMHRYPVRVVAVDGYGTFVTNPAVVEPGERRVRFTTVPVRGFENQSAEREFTMTLAPCTRYRVSAERESSLSLDWALRVDGEEPVPGCDPSRARG